MNKDLIDKIIEQYPTWQKVDLTKVGYIMQREVAILNIVDIINEEMDKNNRLMGEVESGGTS